MRFGHGLIIGTNFRLIIRPFFFRQKRAGDAHCTAGIGDVNRLTGGIIRIDFDSRMNFRGRRPANQQRNIETPAFHFGRHMTHLVKAWRNQPAQTDNVDLLFYRAINNIIGRNHDAHIDDIEIIALQHNANDILANVMHVALHRCHQHLAF